MIILGLVRQTEHNVEKIARLTLGKYLFYNGRLYLSSYVSLLIQLVTKNTDNTEKP